MAFEQAIQPGDWAAGRQFDADGHAIAYDPTQLDTIKGVQQKANYGPYVQQLLANGTISEDRVLSGSAVAGSQGQRWFPGTDGNIYLVDGTGQRPVTRIPMSNIDPRTGKDKVGSVSDFLDPNTGAVTGTGKADFAKIDPGEMVALAIIAATTGGAALTGLGLMGGAAGAAGGAGGAGAAGAAASPWESGLLASGVEVGAPMSVGLPVGTALPAMGAMAGAGGALGASAGGGGAAGGGAAGDGLASGAGGVSPPPNPYNLQSYLSPTNLGNLATSSGGVSSLLGQGASSLLGNSNLLGLGATALGGILGSQPQTQNQSSTRTMDPRVAQSVYGALLPKTDALLNAQDPLAQQYGAQMGAVGQGLLNTPVRPDEASNPYLTSIADDMQRRTSLLLGQNNQQIAGNAVAAGGLGGSRQGVAQGQSAAQAADTLQGNVANLYGQAYNQDANRNLQQITLGAGLMGQGLNTSWQPVQNATAAYSPFTGYGTTTQTGSQGGGMQGALGGALGAAQLGKNLGFWGSSSTPTTSSAGLSGNIFGDSSTASNPWNFSNSYSWS